MNKYHIIVKRIFIMYYFNYNVLYIKLPKMFSNLLKHEKLIKNQIIKC